MSETLRRAAAEMREKIDDLVHQLKADTRMSQILTYQQALNGVEEILGEPKTTLSSLFALQADEDIRDQGPQLVEDEFHHLNQLDAAKAYLRKVGRPPRTLEEIVDAVNSHGGKVTNQKELAIQLARSTYQVAKVGEKWGLAEWYSDRKKTKRQKAGAISEEMSTEEMEEGEQDESVSRGTEDQPTLT